MNDDVQRDDAALEAAQQVLQHAQDVSASAPTSGDAGGLDRLLGVDLVLSAELGRCRMQISEILDLGVGSVVELDQMASEPVEILVNGSVFARGEVVVNEDHFAVKITELADQAHPNGGAKR